jgi:hypothetical protein
VTAPRRSRPHAAPCPLRQAGGRWSSPARAASQQRTTPVRWRTGAVEASYRGADVGRVRCGGLHSHGWGCSGSIGTQQGELEGGTIEFSELCLRRREASAPAHRSSIGLPQWPTSRETAQVLGVTSTSVRQLVAMGASGMTRRSVYGLPWTRQAPRCACRQAALGARWGPLAIPPPV